METSHKKLWTVTGSEEVGKKPYKIRSLGKAGQTSVAQKRLRDKSRVMIGVMISSAKQ